MHAVTHLLTKDEVRAAIGGIAISTLDLWVRQGKFPEPLRLNGEWTVRWRSDVVQDWIDRQPTATRPGKRY